MGSTVGFKLFQRLSRRPGQYASYDALLQDIWHGHRTDATVRSAVKDLKTKLTKYGMADLARAIRGKSRCYALILDESASGQG